MFTRAAPSLALRTFIAGSLSSLVACVASLSPAPGTAPSEECEGDFQTPRREQFPSSLPCGAPEVDNEQVSRRTVSAPLSKKVQGIPAGVYDVVNWTELTPVIGGPERLVIFEDRTFIRRNVFGPNRSSRWDKFGGGSSGVDYVEFSSGTVVVTDNTLTFKKDCTVVRGGGQLGEWQPELEETWAYRVGFDCSTEFVLWRDEIGASTPNGVTYVRR